MSDQNMSDQNHRLEELDRRLQIVKVTIRDKKIELQQVNKEIQDRAAYANHLQDIINFADNVRRELEKQILEDLNMEGRDIDNNK